MDRRRKLILSLIIMLGIFTLQTNAQDKAVIKTLPLHVEASLMFSTSHNKVMPFGEMIDINYNINRFSIHALLTTEYFIPKEGLTKNYNKTLNLGGGIGFELFPQEEHDRNVFEARASVTAGLGSNRFKNTSYRIGLEWHRCPGKRCLVPTIGVGYNMKDFNQSGMSNYHGMYLSFGLRF